MIVQNASGVGDFEIRGNHIVERVRRIGVAIPVIVMTMSIAALLFSPTLGLLGGALLMGWSQLVGL